MTCALLIEPHDLLFCRDGRSIVAGAGSAAGSSLPNPQVIAGCIRSAALRQRGLLPDDGSMVADSAIASIQTIRIRGPLPFDRDRAKPVIPCPADVASQGKNKHGTAEQAPFVRLGPLSPVLTRRLHWQGPAEAPHSRPLWSTQRGHGEQAAHETSDVHAPWHSQSGWLDWDGFLAWQAGGCPERSHYYSDSDLWTTESRTQVALDAETAMASDGLLFTTRYLRLQSHVGLYIEVDGADDLLPNIGDQMLALLGGDRRTVTLRRIPAIDWPQAPEQPSSVACALTPTLLDSDCHCPEAWREHCIALAVGGHLPISGWDLAANAGQGAPRPTRNALASGAVWHVDPAAAYPPAIGNETENGFGWIAWGRAPR